MSEQAAEQVVKIGDCFINPNYGMGRVWCVVGIHPTEAWWVNIDVETEAGHGHRLGQSTLLDADSGWRRATPSESVPVLTAIYKRNKEKIQRLTEMNNALGAAARAVSQELG